MFVNDWGPSLTRLVFLQYRNRFSTNMYVYGFMVLRVTGPHLSWLHAVTSSFYLLSMCYAFIQETPALSPWFISVLEKCETYNNSFQLLITVNKYIQNLRDARSYLQFCLLNASFGRKQLDVFVNLIITMLRQGNKIYVKETCQMLHII